MTRTNKKRIRYNKAQVLKLHLVPRARKIINFYNKLEKYIYLIIPNESLIGYNTCAL